ncbi:unnamed protein product [Timema podura]|uniref:Uncharacterized protein n=1 Tax=Timema podura TaxID=61482 RepID=A0ABN7NMQ0_TIMPD|nr:unnamed protein product [Timema podura]
MKGREATVPCWQVNVTCPPMLQSLPKHYSPTRAFPYSERLSCRVSLNHSTTEVVSPKVKEPFLCLGGVFIATLFGLALAMITLAGEIFYYKRKKTNTVGVPNAGHQPPVGPKKQITIGKEFRPVMDKAVPRVSYISVFPRNQLY